MRDWSPRSTWAGCPSTVADQSLYQFSATRRYDPGGAAGVILTVIFPGAHAVTVPLDALRGGMLVTGSGLYCWVVSISAKRSRSSRGSRSVGTTSAGTALA